MTALPWVRDDGGREAAGSRGRAGDCVPRAIAIASGLPYRQVYDELQGIQRDWMGASRSRAAREARDRRSKSVRDGTWPDAYKPYLALLGWTRTSTMAIGSGVTVHLATGELPMGRLIVQVSKHLVAVIDGVVHDTHDCTRGGTRAVYGYWIRHCDETRGDTGVRAI